MKEIRIYNTWYLTEFEKCLVSNGYTFIVEPIPNSDAVSICNIHKSVREEKNDRNNQSA